MPGVDWQLADRIIAVLKRDIGRTDDELEAMLATDYKTLSRTVGVLYRQGKVDRCWRWVVLGVNRNLR